MSQSPREICSRLYILDDTSNKLVKTRTVILTSITGNNDLDEIRKKIAEKKGNTTFSIIDIASDSWILNQKNITAALNLSPHALKFLLVLDENQEEPDALMAFADGHCPNELNQQASIKFIHGSSVYQYEYEAGSSIRCPVVHNDICCHFYQPISSRVTLYKDAALTNGIFSTKKFEPGKEYYVKFSRI